MGYNYDGVAIVALSDLIESQLTTYFDIDSDDLEISRSYQPTKQYMGATTDTKKYQIFITPISSGTPIGSGFYDTYDEDEDAVTRTYQTIKPSTYQFDFLADYDPSDDASLEAMDLAQLVKELFSQVDFIGELTDAGLFISQATTVRPNFSMNNEGQFESTPSFDLTLSYNSNRTKSANKLSSVEGDTYRGDNSGI